MIEPTPCAMESSGTRPNDPSPTPGAAVAWNWQRSDPAAALALEARAARKQGALAGGVGLVVAALLAFLLDRPRVGAVVATLAALSTLAALASPTGLYRALTRLLDRFAHAVGTIVTWILMVVLYALLFVPVGWILRSSGRIALRAKADPAAPTLWGALEPTAVSLESYRKQF